LLGVAKQIHDAMLGVAEEDAVAVGEQVQVGAARGQIGQTVAEVAAQQGHHAADALKTEAAAAEVAEHGQFGEIFGGVDAAMAFAGGHHDSLLVPPLKLAWREAGTLGNLAGCKALAHRLPKPDLGINCKEQSLSICLKHNCTEMLHPY
jgi:hypothetical protein